MFKKTVLLASLIPVMASANINNLTTDNNGFTYRFPFMASETDPSDGTDTTEDLPTECSDGRPAITRGELDAMIAAGDDVSNVCTIAITDMSWLFKDNATFDQRIDTWNTSNVTTMEGMFYNATNFCSGCAPAPYEEGGAPSINNWNVSKVTNMAYMFYGTQSMASGLTKWDVSNVQTMDYMFFDAVYPHTLNDWNTASLTSMEGIFGGSGTPDDYFMSASIYTNTELSNWDTSKVTNMKHAFKANYAFNADISSWNTSQVRTMEGMFMGAASFNQDLDSWNTSNLTNIKDIFYATSSYSPHDSLSVNGWDSSNITNMENAFRYSNYSGELSNWDMSRVENTKFMFFQAKFSGDIPNWRFANLKEADGMFSESLYTSTRNDGYWDLSGWDLTGSTSVSGMFRDIYEGGTFNLNNWNLSTVKDASEMFARSYTLDPTLQNVNWGSLENVEGMFSEANAATSSNLDLANWNVSSVKNFNNMFKGSTGIFEEDELNTLSGWNVSSATSMDGMFQDNVYMNLDLTSWDVSNVNSWSNFYTGTRLEHYGNLDYLPTKFR